MGSSRGDWARLAQLPASGDAQGSRLSFALASPTWPQEGVSRTCLCTRWGCRGLRAICQVSFGVFVPFPIKSWLSVQSSLSFFYCGVAVWVSASPAKLPGLRLLPTGALRETLQPGLPRRPSHCPLSGTARSQMVWRHRAPLPLPPPALRLALCWSSL